MLLRARIRSGAYKLYRVSAARTVSTIARFTEKNWKQIYLTAILLWLI